MKSLLLKPRWVEGESWPGYLLRLAEVNQLTSGLHSLANLTLHPTPEMLSSPPTQVLWALGFGWLDVPCANSSPAGWHNLAPFRAGRSRWTSFCPACFREAGGEYQLAIGDLPLQLSCPKHGCALVRNCPACREPITVSRFRVAQCDCGQLFSRVKSEPLMGQHQILQKLLQLNRTSLAEVPTFAAAGLEDVAAVQLVQYLAHASGPGWKGSSRKTRIYDAWATSEQLEAASSWFTDWPTSFEERYSRLMLDRRARGERPLCNAIRTIRSFPALAKVVDSLIARRRQSPRPKKIHAPPREYLTLKELMSATGVHYDTIQGWIASGRLGTVEILPRGAQSHYKIPRELGMSAVRFIKATASVSEMAAEVGLTTSALHTLVQCGYVDAAAVAKSTYTARVKPQQIHRMTRDILAMARGQPRRPLATCTLSDALVRARRVGKRAPGELVAAVRSGSLEVHKTDKSDTTLASVSITRDNLSRWFRTRRE